MPDTILVPIDGSLLSERALWYAAENFPTASITTVYVINPFDSVIASEAGGLPDAEEWYGTAQDRATAIHDATAEIAEEYGVEIDTVTEVGRPSRTILDYVDKHGVDQIIMGSHGRDGIDRVILGSVAEAVMRRGRQPVTTIR